MTMLFLTWKTLMIAVQLKDNEIDSKIVKTMQISLPAKTFILDLFFDCSEFVFKSSLVFANLALKPIDNETVFLQAVNIIVMQSNVYAIYEQCALISAENNVDVVVQYLFCNVEGLLGSGSAMFLAGTSMSLNIFCGHFSD